MFPDKVGEILPPVAKERQAGPFEHLVLKDRVGRTVGRGGIFGGGAGAHSVRHRHLVQEGPGSLVPGGVAFGGGVGDPFEIAVQQRADLSGEGQ